VKPTREIKKAYDIAVADLRSCYSEEGILAGRGQFSDYWGRDSFFASFGALDIGDDEIVKKNLSLFLEHTKEDGTVPLRVGEYNIIPKIAKNLFAIRIKGKSLEKFNRKIDKIEKKTIRRLRARYVNDRNKNFPLDSNSLFLVSFYYYLKKTKDKKFAKENFYMLEKILEKNFNRDKDYKLLLKNVHGSSWDDSLNIRGVSIYTNVCHCASIRSLWKIAKIINHKHADKYEKIYYKVKDKVNNKLWNGEYYSNFILGGKQIKIFSTAGNLLAMHWHVSDKDQALSIQDKIEKYGISKHVPSMTNYPKYPNKFVSLAFKSLGMSDYHNMGMCWLWLGAEDAIVKYKLGLRKKAFEVMQKMAKTIVKYNSVYEVYEQNGEPVNRLIYKSEASFAWSSGLFIMAYKTIFSRKKSVLKWDID
jgi:glycogen debranching enzyme